MKPANLSHAVGRWLLAAGLLVVLLELGSSNEPLFAWLTRSWQTFFEAVGLGNWLRAVQPDASSEVARRSLPAVLSYAGLYLGLSLLLLRVLAPSPAQWWLAARLYAAGALLYGLLLLAGRLGGHVVPLYRAARHLIDFLVSPLPVMLLAVLLNSPLARVEKQQ